MFNLSDKGDSSLCTDKISTKMYLLIIATNALPAMYAVINIS